MTFKVFVLMFLLSINICYVNAQREKFEKHIFQTENISMPYRLLKPAKIEEDKKYPLVLYFHGIGVRGDDNEKTLLNGVWHLAKDEFIEKYPAFVIVPQCPSDMRWTEYSSASEIQILSKEINIAMQTVLEIMQKVISDFSIDTNRIYVSGMSMGGFATWEIIMRFPDVFAAAVPVCGGGDTSFANQITHIPIWAFHGALDKIVPPLRSIEMVESINNVGGNAKISIFENVGHDVWLKAYEMPEMYEWLFNQKKSKN